MSFHPMMTLLVRGGVEILGPAPSVVELGNQTFTPDDATLRRVLAHTGPSAAVDRAALESLLREPPPKRRDKTEAYYRALGFSDYRAIDVNDTYGSLVMDLNCDLRVRYGFDRSFSLVTNNGTGEHIFDQRSVFQNAHALTEVGGIQLHVLPFLNYVNHGFFSFHPNLFHALARANGYRLVALGVGNRLGHAVMSRPDAGESAFEPPLHSCLEVDLETLLGRAKFARSSRRSSSPASPGARLKGAIAHLRRTHPDLVVFAVLRKLEETRFRLPIQSLYAEAISDPELRTEYLLPAPQSDS